MLKYIILFILYGLINNVAFAEKAINIKILFGGITDQGITESGGSNYFTNPKLESSVVSCAGKSNAYYVSGSSEINNETGLNVEVKGIFDGDKRNDCKLKDDSPYFILKDLKFSFYYRGKYSECLISQRIGTSWDSLQRKNDKLQGDEKDTHLVCDNSDEFMYRLVPGHGTFPYSPGFIQIYNNDYLRNKESIRIQNTTVNPLNVKIKYKCKQHDSILIIPPMTSRRSYSFRAGECTAIPDIYLINENGIEIGKISGSSIQADGKNSWHTAIKFEQYNTSYMYNKILGNATAGVGHSSIVIQIYDSNKSSAINMEEWLKPIPDNTNLNRIMMPGSHDAGMDRADHNTLGPLMTHAVITQRYDIYHQLISGSRYFDIRPDVDHGELVTYHRVWQNNEMTIGANGIKIIGGDDSVFEQSYKFLKEHPSEFVILHFMQVRKKLPGHIPDNTKNRLLEDIKSYDNGKYRSILYMRPEPIYDLDRVLKLGDLRGKIFLAFDVMGSPNEFTFSDKIQISDCSDMYGYNSCNGFFPAGFGTTGLAIWHEHTDTTSYENMREDQLHKLNERGGVGLYYLFVLSWTLTGGIFDNLNIRELVTPLIGNLPEVLDSLYHKTPDLKANYNKMPNIVFLDFINPYTDMSIVYYDYLNLIPNWAGLNKQDTPIGSYKDSCNNINYVDGQLSAMCWDGTKERYSRVFVNKDIECMNKHGILVCGK